ncbi:MAG: DUF4145 domain-containing protein [Prevotella sp.]|nr:DUF4145 domain-containing protein [Prevotella sp.]
MAKNYVAPNKSLKAFTCPHCGVISQMNFVNVNFNGSHAVSMGAGLIQGDNHIVIASCENCKKNIIWANDNYAYPDIVAEEANPDMPESVKQLYNEAGLIYNKSPRAACALLRLAIDRLCNELGETDRDINKNIGELVKKGLSSSVQKALDIVRVVGNKAVHPGQIAFDVDNKETAVALMKLVNMITERMITEPQEIDSMFEQLPDSAKNAIENRDK